MAEDIKYNYLEIASLKRKMELRMQELEKEINHLRTRLTIITHIINDNDENRKDWVIPIPSTLIEGINLKNDEVVVRKKIKWQETILNIIIKEDIPMTSNLLFNKIKQVYPNHKENKRFIQKNISAALATLCDKDILFKIKLEDRKDLIYGLSHHYNSTATQIKEQYFSYFKNETESL